MDANRGLYAKYRVERTDGSSQPGGKHEGCIYFVLDLMHDPHAFPALRAYADSCRADYPALAADLYALAPDNTSVCHERSEMVARNGYNKEDSK